MKIAAIISEFDPFHNGHKYLVDNLRKNGFTHVVSIMSGNFTQRGTPAIVNKYSRTVQALSSGVDLVIGIPVPWCISPAEKYASAGVFLANSLGCVDTLAFSTECGNIQELEKIYNLISKPEFNSHLKKYIKQGLTLAKSYSLTMSDFGYDKSTNIFESPNNILALEYIKSIKNLNSTIQPYTINRVQVEHDSHIPGENIASASYIRSLTRENKDFSSYVPKDLLLKLSNDIQNQKCPSDINLVDRAILAKLRLMSASELSNISDVSEGLENRIISSLKDSYSLEDLYTKVKTKRYTLARIRRIILCSFLGISKEFLNYKIPYIHTLGTNKNGLEILKIMKRTATLPIITKFSDTNKLDHNSKKIFNLECTSSDLYSLMLPSPDPCGIEKTNSIIKYNI